MISLFKKQPLQKVRSKKSDTIEYLIMLSPVILLLFVFAYIPMFGIIIAFKDYKYNLGILGSKWIGFDNFTFFFTSQDAWRVTRNTIGYSLLFLISGTFVSVTMALLLFEIRRRSLIKTYQTMLILPHFISWVVVGDMTYTIFNPVYGSLNRWLVQLGYREMDVYMTPWVWTIILPLIHIWKGTGMGMILYYAALMGINKEYYEAATIDGASKFQLVRHISIPFLIPVMSILVILALGNIFRADFGLFYEITRNSGMLYRTTDVIDTYIFRALRAHGDIGMSSSVGVFQSFVGFITIILANLAVRKMDPDMSLF